MMLRIFNQNSGGTLFVVLMSIFCVQIPPAPPKPDFEASREKLGKLSEGEGSMTKEEFTRMKQELEAYESVVFYWDFN